MIKAVSKPDNVTIYLDEYDKTILSVQDFPIYDEDNPDEIFGYEACSGQAFL